MNAEARRLQAYDTVAKTPSGLDKPGQLTSAYDLALISRAGLADPDFRRYVSTRLADFPAPRGKTYQIANHNRLLGRYKGMIGVKNGWTSKARASFVGAAKRDGHTIIVVDHAARGLLLGRGRRAARLGLRGARQGRARRPPRRPAAGARAQPVARRAAGRRARRHPGPPGPRRARTARPPTAGPRAASSESAESGSAGLVPYTVGAALLAGLLWIVTGLLRTATRSRGRRARR